jgi:hypothetical protein
MISSERVGIQFPLLPGRECRHSSAMLWDEVLVVVGLGQMTRNDNFRRSDGFRFSTSIYISVLMIAIK